MNVYIDESGDLGFTFNKPYRKGGSSRYLTIAFLLIPKTLKHHPRRIVKELYRRRKRKPSNELKGHQLSLNDKLYLVNKVISLLNKYSQIKIFAITVDKRNVEDHIRKDYNKLYNYMIRLALLDRIKHLSKVTFIPDRRSIKVKSGNSLVDYLQTELWLELRVKTTIENNPQESHYVLNLQFIDYICHILWEKYENKEDKAYNILKSEIELFHLFFPS